MKRYTQMQETQMLTGGLEHFAVATPNSIAPTADGSAAFGTQEFNDYYDQARVWERLVEVFRTRANVVIVSDLAAGGFTLAVEHNDAVDAAEIQEKIRELGEVDFGSEEQEVDPDETPDSGDEYMETVPVTVDLSTVTVTKVDYDLL